MTRSREAILNRIRTRLNREPDAKVERPRASPFKLQRVENQDLVAVFEEMATKARAQVYRLCHEAIPEKIAEMVEAYRPRHLVQTPAVAKEKHDWASMKVSPVTDIPERDGAMSINRAAWGVAETGTLVVHSEHDQAYQQHILAQTLVVLLDETVIVDQYESLFAEARKRFNGEMPRAFTWITGPSLTGDIEQTLQQGAHGPKELIILLIKN